MNIFGWREATAAAALCAGLTAFAADAQTTVPQGAAALVPALSFYRHPDLDRAALSPSGRWLAVKVGAASGRYALAVFDLEGDTPPAVIAQFKDIDVDDFQWVGDERLIFDLDDLKRGAGELRHGPGLFSIRRDGSEMRQLIQMTSNFVSSASIPSRLVDWKHRLLHVPPGGGAEGNEVIVGERVFDREADPVAVIPKRLNIVTGRLASVARGTPPRARGWLFDVSGAPRLAVVQHEGRTRIHWRAQLADESPDAWAVIGDWPSYEAPWLPRFVDREGRLYVTTTEGAQRESVLRRFDFASGRPERETLVSTPGFDFTGGLVSENDGDRTLGVRAETDAETTVWFDPAMKALQQEIDRRLPGRINRLSCRRCSDDRRTVLVRSWSDRFPGEYWVWRGPVAQPTAWQRVGVVRKDIDPQRMGTLDLHRFAARDGRRIPVWVTTPAALAPNRKPPAVLLVHGGPWVRGGHWAWRADAQFLASRGYVVIEPEFRGSSGYGAAHFHAGWKQWGRAMQDDLADAVAWAAAQGAIDPARVCIAGASYGGYATLMGLVRHPSLYRCGAAWVGVTEPRLLFKSSWENDTTYEARRYSLPLLLGDPEADAALLESVSPVAQAARIQAPVLLAYGSADRRVPLEHGTRMRTALQAAGQEPQYVVYEDEGHQWRRVETRVDFAQRLEAFLQRHLTVP